MFVYVWVGLGFFLSLLTSSYDAINMFFHGWHCNPSITQCDQVYNDENWPAPQWVEHSVDTAECCGFESHLKQLICFFEKSVVLGVVFALVLFITSHIEKLPKPTTQVWW